MLDIILQPFFLRALAAVVISSLVASLVSVFVVLRRYSALSAAIAHASLAGAVLGLLIGINPLLGALAVSLAFSLAAAYSDLKTGGRPDIMIGVTFGFSTAVAIMLISMMSAYTTSAWAYLIGDVLSVTVEEIGLLLLVSSVVLSLLRMFYKEFKFVTFDKEAAEAMGLNVRFYSYLLVVLIALTTVVLLKVVGSILAVVLLVAPAAAAYQFSHSFKEMSVFAAIFAAASGVLGLLLSVGLNASASAFIGVFASLLYFASLLLSTKKRKCRSITECFRVVEEKRV